MVDEHRRAQWCANIRLTVVALIVFSMIFIGLPLLAPSLNAYYFLRFPLGFMLVTHGIVVAIIALIYWFSRRQEQLDQRFNITGDY